MILIDHKMWAKKAREIIKERYETITCFAINELKEDPRKVGKVLTGARPLTELRIKMSQILGLDPPK